MPRSGTVQATLLNPMGTVVRMFVIPYDMRDMPPLHRTFIRQRILAEELPGQANPCGGAAAGGGGGIMLPPQRREPERAEPSSPTATSTTGKLGHFISAEQMKRLRYSIHLRQVAASGELQSSADLINVYFVQIPDITLGSTLAAYGHSATDLKAYGLRYSGSACKGSAGGAQ